MIVLKCQPVVSSASGCSYSTRVEFVENIYIYIYRYMGNRLYRCGGHNVGLGRAKYENNRSDIVQDGRVHISRSSRF